MSNKVILFKLLTILLFLVILFIGYRQRNELFSLLTNVNLIWLLSGLVFYFCNYATRAYRLRLLTREEFVPFGATFKISALHGFYSYFLPLRSGDISLPFILNQVAGLPLLAGTAILLQARLLDLLSLGSLLFCSTLLSYDILSKKVYFLFLFASAGLVFAPFIIKVTLTICKRTTLRWFKAFAKNISVQPFTLNQIIFSFLIWFWTGCTLFAAAKSIGIPIHFMDIWFLVAIQLPLQLFPLQGIANAGSHEVGWVAGFALLGISPEKGLDFALASHAIIIVYVLVLGSVGFFIPEKSNRSHSSTRS